MGQQGDSGLGCIDDPTQNRFTGGPPGAITFEKFFDGRGLLAMDAVTGFQWAQDGVQGM